MAINITEALETIYNKCATVSTEIIPIEMAVGRVARQECIANFNLPRFNNSAMDGYAVKIEDAGKSVICSDVIYAGDNPKMTLTIGNAIKIMTGAPIPDGCEAVVPIEDVSIEKDRVTLPSNIKNHSCIRTNGEDIEKGSIFIKDGELLNAYSIASLASQGITHIKVSRTIKVAILGTGDELRPHFEKIQEHQLYNSNSPMFLTRSQELGCDTRVINTSADTLKNLEESITSILDADLIITSGGASVGDKDFTKEAFTNLGMQTHFSKVDIKPGKPTTFGTIGKTSIINLPGNPLASMVNYEIFVRAVVRKMSGRADYYHNTVTTKIENDFSFRGGKYSAILGAFNGSSFKPLKPQLPGMVSPMQKADGLIVITPDRKILKKDDIVKMIPIKWEFTSFKMEDIFTDI